MQIFVVFACLLTYFCPSSAQKTVHFWDATPRADVCTSAGTVCSKDCSQVLLCVYNNPGYVQIPLETCDAAASSYCSPSSLSCSTTDKACLAQTLPFVCTSDAYFPDPFDCTKYHVCLTPPNLENPVIIDFNQTCEEGWAYDPLTTSCRYHLTDPVCTNGPVPKCGALGDRGPLTLNPSIYYVCVSLNGVLYPQLYQCPHGYYFNIDASSCIVAPPSTTTTTTTTVAPPVTTPKPPGFQCEAPGLYPDEDDCRSYWICTADLQKRHCTCFYFFYFHPYEHKCVLGFC